MVHLSLAPAAPVRELTAEEADRSVRQVSAAYAPSPHSSFLAETQRQLRLVDAGTRPAALCGIALVAADVIRANLSLAETTTYPEVAQFARQQAAALTRDLVAILSGGLA